MNASDPVDVAEIAKSKAVSQVGINEKDELSIEQAPMQQGTFYSQEDKSGDREYPNDEDLRNLRRVAGKVPWPAYTVAFVELCERFSYYGTTAVCTFYHHPSRAHEANTRQSSTSFSALCLLDLPLVPWSQDPISAMVCPVPWVWVNKPPQD
jgi:hypothetical protein